MYTKKIVDVYTIEVQRRVYWSRFHYSRKHCKWENVCVCVCMRSCASLWMIAPQLGFNFDGVSALSTFVTCYSQWTNEWMNFSQAKSQIKQSKLITFSLNNKFRDLNEGWSVTSGFSGALVRLSKWIKADNSWYIDVHFLRRQHFARGNNFKYW